jgi:hypothetical protein
MTPKKSDPILGKFVNGTPYYQSHFIESERILRRKGVYARYQSFGPYIPEELNSLQIETDRFRVDDYEFIIVETAYMTLGRDRSNRAQFARFQHVPNSTYNK